MKVLQMPEIEQVSGGAGPNECITMAIAIAGGVAALAVGSLLTLPYSIPLILKVTAFTLAPGGLAFVAYNVVTPGACANAGTIDWSTAPEIDFGGGGGWGKNPMDDK